MEKNKENLKEKKEKSFFNSIGKILKSLVGIKNVSDETKDKVNNILDLLKNKGEDNEELKSLILEMKGKIAAYENIYGDNNPEGKYQELEKKIKDIEGKNAELASSLAAKEKEVATIQKENEELIEYIKEEKKRLEKEYAVLRDMKKSALAADVLELRSKVAEFDKKMAKLLEDLIGDETVGSMPIIDSSSKIAEIKDKWLEIWNKLGQEYDQSEIGNLAYFYVPLLLDELEKALKDDLYKKAYQLVWQLVGATKGAKFYYDQVMNSGEEESGEGEEDLNSSGADEYEKQKIINEIKAKNHNDWLDENDILINFYEVLGLDNFEADEDKIKKAYNKEAKENHPDRNGTADENVKKEREEKFKIVSEANQALTKHKEFYDQCLKKFFNL